MHGIRKGDQQTMKGMWETTVGDVVARKSDENDEESGTGSAMVKDLEELKSKVG